MSARERPVVILTHGGGFGAGDKGYTVQFADWRFSRDAIASGRTPPLAGYVVLGPDLQVQDMRIGVRSK